MQTSTEDFFVYITYEGAPQDRFDRDYYINRHLPTAKAAYGQYGLKNIAAFFPSAPHSGTVAVCEMRYTSEDKAKTAFGSIEADDVRADLVRFTDLKPKRSFLSPLVWGASR